MTTATPALSRTTLPGPAVVMAVCAAFALALALRAPLAVTVAGFVLFGALHNVLELRYVFGRFPTLLTGRFLGVLVGLITGIAICRLLALPRIEVILLADYTTGRGIYASLATYHAYLEFPVILALALSVRKGRS